MLTKEQLELRKQYITGSDAAVICGVSPWGNIIDLWRQKLGLMEAEDISYKPAVKAGNYLEPVVAQWFCDVTNKELQMEKTPNGEMEKWYIHPSIPWMAGNIDGRIAGESAILEVKTTARDDLWGEQGDNIIPDYYLCQVAHYVAVCDVERAYIAVLIRGSDFRWYTYERNKKLEDLIISKEKAFWECVQTETPPEPRNMDEVVSLYNQAITDEPLIADAELEECIVTIKECKESLTKYEKLKEKYETRLKAFMKNHDTLYSRSGKIIATWKNAKGAMRFDAKRLSEENKSLYEQYLKESDPTRRFLIK